MKRNISLLLILFFVFCGCAHQISVVDNDGVKIPDSIYISQDFETNLEINAFLAVMKEESGKYQPLNYLDLNSQETHNLGSDIDLIMGKVRIINPQSVHYYLKVLCRTANGSEEKTLYQGNDKEKMFTLQQNIGNIKTLEYIIIVGKGNKSSNNHIFDFDVKIRKEGRESGLR